MQASLSAKCCHLELDPSIGASPLTNCSDCWHRVRAKMPAVEAIANDTIAPCGETLPLLASGVLFGSILWLWRSGLLVHQRASVTVYRFGTGRAQSRRGRLPVHKSVDVRPSRPTGWPSRRRQSATSMRMGSSIHNLSKATSQNRTPLHALPEWPPLGPRCISAPPTIQLADGGINRGFWRTVCPWLAYPHTSHNGGGRYFPQSLSDHLFLPKERLAHQASMGWRSCASHEDQLSAPPVKQAHDPSSRFAAVALVWIVRASAAASSGKVTLAMGLGTSIGVLIGVGHGRGNYLICAASAPAFRSLPTG